MNAVTDAKVREKVEQYRDITEDSLQRVMECLDFDCVLEDWTFPNDSSLYRSVLLRNHALNHGVVYLLHQRRNEMVRDLQMMEKVQKLAKKQSEVIQFEHLENSKKKLLVFDKNKNFVHKDYPLKLGKSLLSVLDRKTTTTTTKRFQERHVKREQKVKPPTKAFSQQCHIGPPNGFVNVPIRIQNLPPINVSGIGARQIVHRVRASTLTAPPAGKHAPQPPTAKQKFRFQPIKTTNETITMKTFDQSIHGTKLSSPKNCEPSPEAHGKRTE
ncbi:uncharacterized protein [Antedon mediterranea]|uniref:uncharacterized protein n=1 Tax=Antedon mediterranea TaxID=105859 RepID=UPI003AF43692